MNNSEKLYNYIKQNGWLLFEAIVGSHAYGTALPDSDLDKKFVYFKVIFTNEFFFYDFCIVSMNYYFTIRIMIS